MQTYPDPAYTFDYNKWIGWYPEFAGCSPQQGAAWFARAHLYCKNNAWNPVYFDGILEQLLYMVTSHLGAMYAPRGDGGCYAASGTPAPPIVGRISSASEGSVSLSSEWDGSGSPSEAFFTQTKYGAEYWQATAGVRTMHYAAQPTMVAGTRFPFVPSAMGRFGFFRR